MTRAGRVYLAIRAFPKLLPSPAGNDRETRRCAVEELLLFAPLCFSLLLTSLRVSSLLPSALEHLFVIAVSGNEPRATVTYFYIKQRGVFFPTLQHDRSDGSGGGGRRWRRWAAAASKLPLLLSLPVSAVLGQHASSEGKLPASPRCLVFLRRGR